MESLPLDFAALARARQQLLAARLIAYQKPLYQVLALDPPRAGGGPPLSLGQVLQGMERAP
jgi:hypothetical protein